MKVNLPVIIIGAVVGAIASHLLEAPTKALVQKVKEKLK